MDVKYVFWHPTVVRYRPHRGGLEEAMKLVREFNSFDEMVDFIAKDLGYSDSEFIDVCVSSRSVCDDRIGWKDSRIVSLLRCGDQFYDPPRGIGFCATEFFEPKGERK